MLVTSLPFLYLHQAGIRGHSGTVFGNPARRSEQIRGPALVDAFGVPEIISLGIVPSPGTVGMNHPLAHTRGNGDYPQNGAAIVIELHQVAVLKTPGGGILLVHADHPVSIPVLFPPMVRDLIRPLLLAIMLRMETEARMRADELERILGQQLLGQMSLPRWNEVRDGRPLLVMGVEPQQRPCLKLDLARRSGQSRALIDWLILNARPPIGRISFAALIEPSQSRLGLVIFGHRHDIVALLHE